ncbi:outer membrane lipoprotein-sorting protein [Pseudoalteromonas rubra]|uniref:Outer membrane lipoprotein-sorting protein n=1 Tax=Pseudoalteromonas rubra TaxID=43658 RepID=A0A4Q7ENP3_9GAMM|nr:outer membrane lipoprotein-sorting protein [Pseudoalteromonas rubra]RZM85201.1 outer membrane lipoprotein-sorting protein [Pseudoalteromonas rubra]
MLNLAKKNLTNVYRFVVPALLLSSCYSMAASIDAKSLMEKRQQHNSGWHSSKANLEMVLYTPSGETSTRKMRNMSLEVVDDGDKSLSMFDEPHDVSGVAFLNHSYVSKMDNQWLYLPSLKRVKRISSNNKSSSFMGSEFAYEDMSSFEVGRYSYGAASQDNTLDKPAFVVESTPSYPSSGYTKLKTWLDAGHYQPLQVEFFDKRGELLKRLTLKDYKQYKNGVWRAHTLEMANVQNGRKTVLRYSNFDFTVSLADKDFNKNVLKRIR